MNALMSGSGRANPKIFELSFVRHWLNPLSKFLDPLLILPCEGFLNGPSYILEECSALWGKCELVFTNVLNTLAFFSMLLVAVQE